VRIVNLYDPGSVQRIEESTQIQVYSQRKSWIKTKLVQNLYWCQWHSIVYCMTQNQNINITQIIL